MKVQHSYSEDLISNVDQVEASIDSSGKVFRILTSNLYSNKPESITREIWSNAFDAHKEAGVADKPFEVVFPSAFRQEFMCRDFGNGLSHDFMLNKYTVLGFSTKENTNEAVGKWGIGRLAPLSYTSTYTVTSYHKGMMGVYNVVTLPSGRPVVQTLMEPVPSDQPSGVCISFPVNNSDLDSFKRAARRVALGFEVTPIVVGQPDFDWAGLNILSKGAGYEIYERNYTISGPLVRMGCVLYPIKTSLLSNGNVLEGRSIILSVDIGKLEVTPSREDLSYGPTEPTKATLEAAIESLQRNFVADLQASVDAAESPYEATKIAIKGSADFRGLAPLKLITYKGKPVQKEFVFPTGGAFLTWSSSKMVDLSYYDVNKIFFYKVEGKNRLTRVRDRIKEARKTSSRLIFIPYSDQESRDLDAAKAFFPKNLFVDLATVNPPASVRKPKGQLQVRDLSYNPITITFEDGGLFVPMVGGECSYNFKALAEVLLEDKDTPQIVRVPKGLTQKFEDSDLWTNLLDYARVWAKDHLKDLLVVAETYAPYGFDYELAEMTGKALTKFKTLASAKELVYTNPKLEAGISANGVRNFLQTIGVPFKNTQEDVIKACMAEQERILKDEYPLYQHIRPYTSSSDRPKFRQEYIALVDKAS